MPIAGHPGQWRTLELVQRVSVAWNGSIRWRYVKAVIFVKEPSLSQKSLREN